MHLEFQSKDERGVVIQLLESVYRFGLGAIAGGNNFHLYHFFKLLFIKVESFI